MTYNMFLWRQFLEEYATIKTNSRSYKTFLKAASREWKANKETWILSQRNLVKRYRIYMDDFEFYNQPD